METLVDRPIRIYGMGGRQKLRLCFIVGVLSVAGCATAAQRQAQHAAVGVHLALGQMKTCVRSVADNPQYASLLVHTPNLDTGQHTMAQLTDETVPTAEEARLFAKRYDDVNICRSHFLTALSSARPDLVPVFADAYAKSDGVAVQLVERKITWAAAARSSDQSIAHLRRQLEDANQTWIANLEAENQAELAQRRAAAAAVMQWSQQQQMINAINRPVTTNCNRFGSMVNCTSY